MKVIFEYRRATCPACFGPLQCVVEGTEPGQHDQSVVCTFCGRDYYFMPWPENQQTDATSEPIRTAAEESAPKTAVAA